MYHDDILKLIVATLLGGILGLERQMKRKPLGLKTCLVISVTSCLLTIVSIDSATLSNQIGGIVRSDPMRLAAQIVSGIGFLGAGVIMRKNNEVISGLTTAAMVWASAGLGISVGAGYYADSVAGLVLLIVSVEIFPLVMKKMGPKVLREKEVEITLVVESGANLTDITERVYALESKINRIRTKERIDNAKELTLLCVVHRKVQLTDLFVDMESMTGVLSVDIVDL